MTVPGFPLTQQYIVGEFSSLLAELQPAPSEMLGDALDTLRHQVEFGPASMLPRLAHDAMDLADVLCRVALERGDVNGFSRYVDIAVALREFTSSANLLR